MVYIHFCPNCHRIHMLNGHKLFCPKCKNPLTELHLSYLDYVAKNPDDRHRLLEMCGQEDSLKNLSTTYRMYKYNKCYKELAPESMYNKS